MGPMMMPGTRHMMGPGHPGMHQGMGNRPPPPEYSMSSQGQSMPYMMGQMGMGPGGPMRMPSGMGPGGSMGPAGGMGPGGPGGQGSGPPPRNPGIQQIPPSGPMMRHQTP